MIDRLIIHAGLHKTGSSSIQAFLARNRERLSTDFDIQVPTIAGLLRRTPDLRGYATNPSALAPLAELDSAVCLLSRENFAWIDTPEALIELQRHCARYARQVAVLFYLRRQDALAVSQKQEGTKWPDCALAYGHEPAALPSRLSDVAAGYLDFQRRVGMWGDAFGDRQVTLRVFESDRLHGGDVLADFAALLELPAGEFDWQRPLNASLTRRSQLFLHQTRAPVGEHSPAKHFLVLAANLYDRTIQPRDKLLPGRAEAQAFYAPFVAGNRALAERFGVEGPADLFTDDFSHYPVVASPAPLDDAQLRDYLDEMVSAVDRKADVLMTALERRKDTEGYLGVVPLQFRHRLHARPALLGEACLAAAGRLPASFGDARLALGDLARRLGAGPLHSRVKRLQFQVGRTFGR
ncbi:hypothetical protein E4634_13190 [Mangrovimicrobium sediminis]|uniref:Sulfotransferase family protein n=1 Tax=Mangrovimicrobium sediminis TaxID=2562682 RepID=A0A4Z0LYM6_9GAMM|nr:hypothetical protein [Haliea sp. SAOS-164]TGD72483.1 hypothetical protein E4634_13190 [Haliea sp. SAOS-164]